MAITILNSLTGSSLAMLVPHLNSIFTTEALTIYLALTTYVSEDDRQFLLIDSHSVLSALKSSSLRSPRVITLLHNIFHWLLLSHHVDLTIVWCPATKVSPNEVADPLTPNDPCLTLT